MRLFKLGVPLVVTCALSSVAATVPDPIAVRKDGFHTLGSAFKNIRDELKSSTPQPLILKLSGKQIGAAGKAIYGWFPVGSGPREGVKTEARADVWSKPAEFKSAMDAFSSQAKAFAKVSASGDVTKIGPQVGALGKTCGGCHKVFREEDK